MAVIDDNGGEEGYYISMTIRQAMIDTHPIIVLRACDKAHDD